MNGSEKRRDNKNRILCTGESHGGRVVRPEFQLAVDDILRKNPFEFQMATVLVNDAVTCEVKQ